MAIRTVKPDGTGDFTSLAAALSDSFTVGGDIVEISGDWTGAYDSTAAVVTDANITIRAAGVSRHNGRETNGANYKLQVSSSHCLEVRDPGCVFDGLIFVQNGTGVSNEGIRFTAASSGGRVVNSIVRAATSTSQQDGIFCDSSGGTLELENVIVTGFQRNAINPQNNVGASTMTVNAISLTEWNNGAAVVADARNAGDTTAISGHNCVFGSGALGNFGLGTQTWNLDHCAASDGSITAVDPGAVGPLENASIIDGVPGAGDVIAFRDITTAPFDLRLQDHANNDAQDRHAGATGAGLTFGDFARAAVDIAGTARPQNTNYDLGAFEVVAGGGVGLLRLVPETVPTTEASTATLSLARSKTENMQAAEAVASALGKTQALDETVQSAEALLNGLGKVEGILETLRAEEATAASLALARLITSPVEAPEAVLGARHIARSFVETVEAVEAFSSVRSLSRPVTDALTASEVALPRLLAIDSGTAITLAGMLIGRIDLTGVPLRRVDLSGRLSKVLRLEGKKP